MESSTSGVSEDTAKQVFDRAAELHAQYNKQVSISELISAGEAAQIPAEFIEQALQEVTTQQPQKPSQTSRKQIQGFVLKLGILATAILGLAFVFEEVVDDGDLELDSLAGTVLLGGAATAGTAYMLKGSASYQTTSDVKHLHHKLTLLEHRVTSLTSKMFAPGLFTEEEPDVTQNEKIASLAEAINQLTARVSDMETNLIDGLLATLPSPDSIEENKKLEDPEDRLIS
ncbi:hypothetical protein ACQ4M4_17505 [Leptolyngbya sp. AN02str]|uniref:hypothetical protein n=1 Tax=Leptolyngbya sp. AN02str TaxID=3423363 RepID=UPI003D3144A6